MPPSLFVAGATTYCMKLSQLTANPSLTADDLIYCVDDAAGTPQSRRTTVAAVLGLSYSTANTWTGLQTFTATNASTKGLIVKGAASQTANLTEWQNNSGTVLNRVRANGYVTIGTHDADFDYALYVRTSAAYPLVINNLTTSTFYVTSSGTLTLDGNIQSNSSSGFVNLGTNSSVKARYFKDSSDAKGYFDTGVSGIAWQFNNQVASNIPVVVKGAASQTANLQEWQDSSGTALAAIRSNGTFDISSAGIRMAAYTLGSVAGTLVFNTSANFAFSHAVIAPKFGSPAGGQNVGMTLGPASVVLGVNESLFTVGIGGAYITGTVAGTVPFIVTGAASQTANLQEWRNSAAGVVARVSPTGRLSAGPGGIGLTSSGGTTFSDGGTITLDTNTRIACNRVVSTPGIGSYAGGGDWFDFSFGNITTAVNQFSVNKTTVTAPNAGTVPLTVKGAASQTANLQEWQNSAGTALASVGASGGIEINTTGQGVILKSPDGTRYRVTVANGGTLTTTAL